MIRKGEQGVTEPLPPKGFWSYARADDRNSGGQISLLRGKLEQEIEILMGRRLNCGRTPRTFRADRCGANRLAMRSAMRRSSLLS